MTPDELREELASGEIRTAYLIAGEEALLRDDALAAVREAVLAEGPRDFNFDRLDGAKTTPAALADAVRTLPVLAARRLVVLRDPDARAGRLADALAELVPEVAAGGDTVLAVVANRADGRARWVKAFGPALVRCEPPRGDRAVTAFVREEAERQGVALGRGAAELLSERIGPQLLQIRRELEKLSLFVGAGQKVTREHVAQSITDLADEPIWDLTDAIGEGRPGRALAVLMKLRRTGQPGPVVLAALASHFRKLVRLRTGASVAGPPFVVRKLEGQARRYTPSRLLACLRAIHDTDTALKGEGSLRPELALERLVLGLSA